MPGERLLTVYHRSIGELTKQVGGYDKQQSGHETRRGGILPPGGVITGCPDKIVDVLDADPEVTGTDRLVDEVGGVHVFHGNEDGVCAATGPGWESVTGGI